MREATASEAKAVALRYKRNFIGATENRRASLSVSRLKALL